MNIGSPGETGILGVRWVSCRCDGGGVAVMGVPCRHKDLMHNGNVVNVGVMQVSCMWG